ncbi:MAG: rod shape-determining protein RodA [Bacteroidetes bacterium]|nr:rod shape-determining protein RodA [Bacteroidota bacterium]
MKVEKGIFYRIDWVMVILYLALVLMGWLNIYAAVYNDSHQQITDMHQKYGKQMIFILAAMILAVTIIIIEPKFFSQFAYFLYGFFLVMLIVVIFAGREISGSKSWFAIGGFGIQPAEFAKMATALALAKFLGSLDRNIKNPRHLIMAVVIIILPALFILLEHDTGSALVFLCFVLVLYRAGLTGYVLLALVAMPVLGVLALIINKFILTAALFVLSVLIYIRTRRRFRHLLIVLAVFLASTGFVFSVHYTVYHILEPHQRQRINVLLGNNTDLKGAGYNVNQSLIAIGSGRLLGKGFLQGTQTKYNFVPEQSTDFIFCTVGEEHGFIGSLIVIALFLGLMIRIVINAERQRSKFSRLYGYGVASLFFIHFSINIGMALGLLPVIGIPLPFFSYGGSSLWAFTILLFIFIKQDALRYELV